MSECISSCLLGRQLDGLPAAIEALPEIANIVAGRTHIYLDGGMSEARDLSPPHPVTAATAVITVTITTVTIVSTVTTATALATLSPL